MTLRHPVDSGPVFILKEVALKFRNVLTLWWDPVVLFHEGDLRLHVPLLQRMANLHTEWPLYDKALPRLREFILEQCGSLQFIDVGANSARDLRWRSFAVPRRTS